MPARTRSTCSMNDLANSGSAALANTEMRRGDGSMSRKISMHLLCVWRRPGYAGEVAAGPRQAFDQARADRIARQDDDRDVAGRALGGEGAGREQRDDDVDAGADQIACEFGQAGELSFGGAKLERVVAALVVTELRQAFLKLFRERRRVGIADHQRADPPDSRRLRQAGCRPQGRAAGHSSDKTSPVHFEPLGAFLQAQS